MDEHGRARPEGLSAVAAELYRLGPAEFTAARNAEADRARREGDGELAAAVKALRRPSAGAWVVNLIARHEPDALDELLQLGDRLRVATDSFAGDELRSLSRQRHQAVATVTSIGARLAGAAGQRLTDSARRDVLATLDAAIADEAAASAVRSGRLVRALVPAGFDPVDLTGAVADPGGPVAVETRPHLHAVAPTAGPTGPTGPEGPARANRAAVDEARNRAALAERSLVRADAARSTAVGRVELARARLADVQRMLDGAAAEVADLDAALTVATEHRDEARAERDRARQALRRAESARS